MKGIRNPFTYGGRVSVFTNPNRPFYRMGKIFPLGKIPSDQLARSDESPFRQEILKRFAMSQPTVMMRALRSLMDKDLIDREGPSYRIVDPFFSQWITTYISHSQTEAPV